MNFSTTGSRKISNKNTSEDEQQAEGSNFDQLDNRTYGFNDDSKTGNQKCTFEKVLPRKPVKKFQTRTNASN